MAAAPLAGLGSVLSFLTILPLPAGTLEAAARHMWLFPVAGIAIGLLAGSVGLGLDASGSVDPLLVGVLVAASLVVVTGAHHLDGLADFADGLMAGGTPDRKLRAMRDASVGSAGMAATSLCVVGLVASISLTGGLDLLRAVLVSEILAKFAMVLAAGLGRPASPGGSGSVFVAAMARDRRGLAAASGVMMVPVVVVGHTAGLAMLGATVAVTLAVLAASRRGFGGVTGDVMGAANELARLASLMVFVAV